MPVSSSTSGALPTGHTQPSSSSLSTGAIAGIAIGAALGGILVFAFLLFFIWKHRKNKRKIMLSAGETEAAYGQKAQLHSDDYKPKREELEGSKVPRKVKVVGGLNEMEHTPLSVTRSEMSVNEAAALEMRADSSITADSFTARGSSSNQPDRA